MGKKDKNGVGDERSGGTEIITSAPPTEEITQKRNREPPQVRPAAVARPGTCPLLDPRLVPQQRHRPVKSPGRPIMTGRITSTG